MLAEVMTSSLPFTSKSYKGARGGTEQFISITAPADAGFERQLELLQEGYAEALRSLGLARDTAVFKRIFLSDAINQASSVRESALVRDPVGGPTAVSIVEQPPLPGGKIALLAYHIEDNDMKKLKLSPKHMIVEKNGLRHLWSTRLCAGAYGSSASVDTQTWEIFGDLIKTISDNGGNIGDNCVRTWIYLKDVDVFYQGMVDSRGRLFRQHGMTEDTHYIASTGIEGACAHQHDLVLMDAYSALDLTPGQMSYLDDLDKLCATKDYNVHFERGTRIAYADRSHYFISGTASIDSSGQVVHRGDVLKQLERALLNVNALLHSGDASLDDMMHFIVYLRDPSDYARIDGYMSERFPDVPTVIVQGPVCRPEWLIEVEGIAIAPNNAPELPSF